ncbi:MAG: glycosyltransferase family 2 protein [Tannerellaceae bacterium]
MCSVQVSILIVNYKTEELVCECISSIQTYTQSVSYEIIVADNNSGDSLDRIRKEYPEVQVIALPENVGFGAANNIAYQASKGEVIFFLNPDTILKNNAVFYLYETLMSNPKIGVCGANMYTLDHKANVSFLPFPNFKSEVKQLLGLEKELEMDSYYNFSSQSKMVDGFISGADMMVRRDVLQRCGTFDPDFFMYYEDCELNYRIKKHGYVIMSVPAAKIVHLQGMSCEAKGEEMKLSSFLMLLRSRYLYLLKTEGKTKASIWHILYSLKCFTAKTIFTFLKNKQKKHYWKSVAEELKMIKRG